MEHRQTRGTRGNGKDLLSLLLYIDLSCPGVCHWHCGGSAQPADYRWGLEAVYVRRRLRVAHHLDAFYLEAVAEPLWSKSPVHRGHSSPGGVHLSVPLARA